MNDSVNTEGLSDAEIMYIYDAKISLLRKKITEPSPSFNNPDDLKKIQELEIELEAVIKRHHETEREFGEFIEKSGGIEKFLEENTSPPIREYDI